MFIKWSGQGTGPAEVMLPGMIKVCNDFYHPASMRAVEDLEEGQHQFCLQVGSAFPEYPIRDSSATYCQLRRTVGHPIHIYIYIYIRDVSILPNTLLVWIWKRFQERALLV